MSDFVSDYCKMTKIALSGYDLLTQSIAAMPPSGQRVFVKVLLGPVQAIKQEIERVERVLVQGIQENASEVLHASHELKDLAKAVYGGGPLHDPDMLRQAEVLPRTVLSMLNEDEENGMRVVTEAFQPLHKKADELLVRLKSF